MADHNHFVDANKKVAKPNHIPDVGKKVAMDVTGRRCVKCSHGKVASDVDVCAGEVDTVLVACDCCDSVWSDNQSNEELDKMFPKHNSKGR